MARSRKRPDDSDVDKKASKTTLAKERKPLDDDAIKKIAHDRLAGYQTPPFKPRDILELAKIHGRDPAQITRAVRTALQRKLITVTLGTTSVERISSMEEELVAAFPQLRRAIVVDSKPSSQLDRDPARDPLYINLGKAAAEFLADKELFQDGDTWSLGSGRAVFRVVTALQELGPLRPQIWSISMAGNFYSRRDTSMGFFLDADANVAQFSSCFRFTPGEEVRHKLVQRPLVCDEGKRDQVMAATCIGSEWKVPDYALMGVGIFAPKHKFWYTDEPQFAGIAGKLKELKIVCGKLSGWVAVADSANRLFALPSPSDVPISDDQKDALAKIPSLLADINSRLLVVEPEGLGMPSNSRAIRVFPEGKRTSAIQGGKKTKVILVAGEASKAPAIRELMRQVDVRYLCTDSNACKELLRIRSAETS